MTMGKEWLRELNRIMNSVIKSILFAIASKRNGKKIVSNDVSVWAEIGRGSIIEKNTSVDKECKIGAYTYVGKNCNLSKSSVGRYCSIANNVSIGQGEHDLNKISTSALFYQNAYDSLTSQPCTIENDVWIGTDVVILRGVVVGNGAVIGANSVVTRDIPPFAIAVGSPARIIRYRFDETQIKKILDRKWWEEDLEKAKLLIKGLENEFG